MIPTAFYERRKETQSIDFANRRAIQRRGQETASSPERRRLASQVRRYEREPFKIQVRLKIGRKEISGYTEDISPEGILVFTDTELNVGIPLSLQFAFGGNVCYLNLSGQVVFSRPVEDLPAPYAIGIKFSGIRDFEQKILASAVQELQEGGRAEVESLIKINVSADALALEAAQLSEGDPAADSRFLHPSMVSVKIQEPILIPALDHLFPTYKLLVNGEDLDTRKYEYFPYADKLIADPKTTLNILKRLKAGEVAENCQEYIFARYCVGIEDINLKAMKAAYEASQEFRYFPLKKRLKIMTDIRDLLISNKERLIELMIIEGHPRKLAEWEFSGMERLFHKQSLEFYKKHLIRKIGLNGEEVLYWRRNPDGVVCVTPPKNAPSSSSLIAVYAFLAGNALIVKPPLKSPISTILLWRNIVFEALKVNGVPPGNLNIVTGNSEMIMDEWIISPYVDDIVFIGDSETGLEIGNRAFQHGKKPILELSGNDMMFVWKDAAIDGAIQSLLDGFLGSMQICMIPKKAFIHEDIYEKFERRFVLEVQKLKAGLPSDPDITLTPVIRIGEFYDFLEDALEKGAELLCGGVRVNHNMIPDKKGGFITPTVVKISDIKRAYEMRCIQEENFFPLMPLVKVSAGEVQGRNSKDRAIFKEMVAIANSNEYGLRTSVWVNSSFYTGKFMEQIQNSGLLRINSRHIGFSPYLATHGGTGKTGGPYGESNYIWEKTTHLQGVSLTRIRHKTQ